jgi:eukaryotic-like serine/threonine-protein kinase
MTSAAGTAVSDPLTRVIAGKYRLDTLLGEGGMGSVWRAFNLQLEAPVAIKLLRSDLDSVELGERLRVEARAAAKLVHPNIVRIFDIGESETGEPFIVMELLDGESMRDILTRGSLSPVNAVQLLLPVAEALALAHSRGVVHRDIKPDNVFIANVGDTLQPKLLDFGIAKVTSTASVGGASITTTGTVLGSPEYMSPEQALGHSDIDPRSDIWSFCVVLYEALAGRTPFTDNTTQAILRAVVQDEPVPLELVAGVDAKLSGLVARGLSKDREGRPQSMFELGQALAAWLFEQGALEDATGAALEYKWLGRGNESADSSHGPGASAPRVRHDEATLVSVVHPAPFVSRVVPTGQPQPRRRRHWAALAAVVGVAFWACAAWAVLRGAPIEVASAGSPQVDFAPAAAPGLAAAAPAPPIVPLQALPIEASTAPATQAARATLQISQPRQPKPSRPARASLWPTRGSLPQALPRSTAAAARPGSAAQRSPNTPQKGPELLNPY